MNRYIARRLVQAVPTLFGITIISFLLMLATPVFAIQLLQPSFQAGSFGGAGRVVADRLVVRIG